MNATSIRSGVQSASKTQQQYVSTHGSNLEFPWRTLCCQRNLWSVIVENNVHNMCNAFLSFNCKQLLVLNSFYKSFFKRKWIPRGCVSAAHDGSICGWICKWRRINWPSRKYQCGQIFNAKRFGEKVLCLTCLTCGCQSCSLCGVSEVLNFYKSKIQPKLRSLRIREYGELLKPDALNRYPSFQNSW